MKDFWSKIKNQNLWMDIFNLFTGILLVIIVVLFCLYPGNKLIIGLMFLMTGIMNLSNGIKKYKNKKTKSMGMVLIMIALITFAAGALLFRLV